MAASATTSRKRAMVNRIMVSYILAHP
jgi:hypothetical protein